MLSKITEGFEAVIICSCVFKNLAMKVVTSSGFVAPGSSSFKRRSQGMAASNDALFNRAVCCQSLVSMGMVCDDTREVDPLCHARWLQTLCVEMHWC